MNRIAALDYSQLCTQLQGTDLQRLADAIPGLVAQNFNRERWGDIPRWLDALQQLPLLVPDQIVLDSDRVGATTKMPVDDKTRQQLTKALRSLHPWRKGPFELFGTHIDTEWRSDWKWQRIAPHINSLAGQRVLDVGCGSGYHCWRMRGAGADLVIGIDPSPLFIIQYWALQHFLQDQRVYVLPAACEELPAELLAFDTVFSMGVLYHRRSPLDHLLELRQLLKPGGQLVLETLVIAGDTDTVLVPRDRYARMGNVWFIPGIPAMTRWLEKMRFRDVQVIDVCATTTDEQRSTDWMTFQSLADFLDPADHRKTIEGYPAPLRAVFIARS